LSCSVKEKCLTYRDLNGLNPILQEAIDSYPIIGWIQSTYTKFTPKWDVVYEVYDEFGQYWL